MLIAQDLFRSVLLRPTEGATLLGSPTRAGAVEGQADPAAIIKGLVALGAAMRESRACRVGPGSSRSVK